MWGFCNTLYFPCTFELFVKFVLSSSQLFLTFFRYFSSLRGTRWSTVPSSGQPAAGGEWLEALIGTWWAICSALNKDNVLSQMESLLLFHLKQCPATSTRPLVRRQVSAWRSNNLHLNVFDPSVHQLGFDLLVSLLGKDGRDVLYKLSNLPALFVCFGQKTHLH